MTREEQAIEYIKKYRELDEKLYNTAPKGTVSSIAIKKCLEFWDMAIKALSQEPCKDMVHIETLRQVMWERDIAIEQLHELGYELGQKIESCDDAISREAVVDDFIEWREKLEYTVGEDYSGVHLLNVAIQKIWDMPPVNLKPTECDDAISREEVMGLVAREHSEWDDLYIDIAKLPSVTQKSEKWIFDDNSSATVCPNCKQGYLWEDYKGTSEWNFCPNCGAKMESEEV